MKILLMSLGTRGDMEPFLAIGELLKQKGHDVICAMPAQFERLVVDTGLRFYSFDKRFMELLESEETKNVLGQKGSIFKQLRGVRRLYLEAQAMQDILMDEQWGVIEQEAPDRILFHPKIHMACLWGMANNNNNRYIYFQCHLTSYNG